jgi:ABC-type thiamin/hydroxymethylpyrimidine transport system permease subunit
LACSSLPEEARTKPGGHRLDLRGIVLAALLAAIGGVLSAYIGYIGNLINRLFGVPFGAGQLIAGLHIVWPLLARLLIGRFGSGTLTGVTKGLVEFLAGGTHGVVIVLVSFVEGLLVDLGMGITRRPNLAATMLAGAVASASNVFVFQALYFSGVSATFILVMAGLSFVSGAFFGGYLSWDLRRLLVASRLTPAVPDAPRARVAWRKHIVTLAVVIGILAGGAWYYVAVYDPFAAPDAARITGAVETPYTFHYGDWDGDTATVTAALQGSVTYVPPQPYTGVALRDLLARAAPNPTATDVRVIADDGYEARFTLSAVVKDATLLLTMSDGRLLLVAAAYDGAHWVKRVSKIVVE